MIGSAAVAAGITGYALVRSLTTPQAPDRVMNTLLYVETQGTITPPWYVEEGLVGQEARLADFIPGRGANAVWRWVADEEGKLAQPGLPALLIQMEENSLDFPEGYPKEEYVVGGLYAIFDCCTHACCRPGWELIPRSYYMHDLGYDNVLCPCHDSQYNPRRIFEYSHPPPPEASGAEYLGIYKEPGVGPANRGMPLIPIELDGDLIVGRMDTPAWYQYLDFD